MEIIKFVIRIYREQPGRLLLIILAQTICGLLEGVGIVLVVPLLELVQNGGRTPEDADVIVRTIQTVMSTVGISFTLISVLCTILVIIVFQQIVYFIQQKLVFGSQYRYEVILRERLYRSIFSADWSFFLKQRSGVLNNALTLEVARVGKCFYIVSFLSSLFLVIMVYMAMAFLLSVPMTLATIAFGATLFVILQKYVSRSTVFGKRTTEANTNMQSEAIESLSAAKLIKGTSMEESTISRFGSSLNDVAGAMYKNALNTALQKVLFDPFAALMLLTGVYSAIVLFKMSASELMVYLFIFYRLAPRMSNLQTQQQSLLSLLPSLDFVDKLQAEAESMRESSGSVRVQELTREVSFQDVDYSYVANKPVLSKISLQIEKGKMVAIVGSSGAGKSTIIDLIMGLIRPDSGKISVDGIDMSELDLLSWRSKIGYVAQDTILFHTSVRDNILWGSPEATEDDLHSAAKLANADEFIRELPDGYDTMIGERGVRLSGGQRQRLALARALIRSPQVLILDEATSALDAESEQKIQAAIDSLVRRLTIVVVTHRLATVKGSDMIYVLENGAIVEQGAWDGLASSDGRFSTLRKIQEL